MSKPNKAFVYVTNIGTDASGLWLDIKQFTLTPDNETVTVGAQLLRVNGIEYSDSDAEIGRKVAAECRTALGDPALSVFIIGGGNSGSL
jgi:hypothetical protein